MNLLIDRNSSIPIYLQIFHGIENMICEGQLPRGYKLPSERQLAAELGVHRNTVVKAYFELISDGFIVASRKKPRGYFVGDQDEAEAFARKFFPLEQMIRYQFDHEVSELMNRYFAADEADKISFGGMILPEKIAYIPEVSELMQKIFSEKGANLEFYQQEMNRLKSNIVKLLGKQNMYVSLKNIQIVAEANQAISYLMDLYVKEGEYIVAEEPMGAEVAGLIRNKGIRIITIPMERDGVDMEKLELAIRRYKPRFFYTMPSYHNPTGVTMSLKKRKKLLQIANKYEMLIIEDDWARWFGYTEYQIPSLYMLDKNKSVVYIDSFTIFFPYGLKVGYLIGPPDLAEMLGKVISLGETVPSSIGHYFLNMYIENGCFYTYIETVRNECRTKCELICKELDRFSQKGISYIKPKGGIIIWCTLPDGVDEKQFADALQRKGVLIFPGCFFYRTEKSRESHFRLCFTNVSEEEIVKGMECIGEVLAEVDENQIDKKKL